MSNIAENFIEALGKLESENDLETIVSLYSEKAEIGNVTTTETDQGSENVRKFWKNYRDTFGEIKSTFKNTIISKNSAALEWNTKGVSEDGAEIDYDGVSILEFEGDEITRFFAYFNPALLGKEIEQGKAKNAS